MVFIKSTNWARVFKAIVWSAVWLAFLGVVYIMAYPLKKTEPVIFAIVMLVAIVGSISFPYVRHNWQRGARWSAVVCAVIGVLCIGTHAVLEGSFWSSIIDKVSQENARVKAVNDANSVVLEKHKERYANSAIGRSPAQIMAEIKALEQNERWASSGGCTKATAAASREFCAGYWTLQGNLAAAKDADNIEGSVWNASTRIETAVTRNFAALALLASAATGYDVQTLTLVIVALIVVCVQAVLAGALFVGFAPEVVRKPHALRQANVTPEAIPAVSVRPRAPMAALERISGVAASPVWKMSGPDEVFTDASKNSEVIAADRKNPEPPTDGGTKAPEQVQNDAIIEPIEPPKVVKLDGSQYQPKPPVNNAKIVREFVRDRLDMYHPDAKIIHTPKGKGRQSGGTPGGDIYDAFQDYCEANGYPAVEFGPFGKLLTKHVKKARNHKRVYYACVPKPLTFIQDRKVAAA